MRKHLVASLAALLVASGALSAHAAGWGNVKGKFVLDGKAPTPTPLKIDKDPAVCGKHDLVDESFVVSKDGEIANIVVALYLKPNAKKPEVHPDFAKDAAAEVNFDNTNCRFEPRVATMRTSQKLILGNTDPIGHNVKADTLVNPAFNILVAAGGKTPVTLKQEEKLPVACSCSIHPWMKGFLVVREDPYVAVSNEKGEFTIPKLPAGTWTLRVWQEKSGFVEEVKVKGKATKWAKGQVEVKIEDGKDFDFGEIKVSPKEFADK